MSKLKIGVFGARRGVSMAKVYLNHPDAELTAVCDKYGPSLERIRKMSKDAGKKITTYQNFDEIFNHDMDAVVLANYATAHVPYAICFL